MPQSHAFLLTHVIFSTRDRTPFISPESASDLYAYLATVVRNTGCECFRVGGVADHVHLAIRLARTTSIAKVVEESKASSSKWIKTQAGIPADFAWQKGYGAFSVGPKDLDALCDYIDSQEEHHRSRTFKDEYLSFLDRYGIDYDERYVWD
jgi:putative transposase